MHSLPSGNFLVMAFVQQDWPVWQVHRASM
jgi:hypothetical protein